MVTARTRRSMLRIKVLSITGLRATQACCTATRNCAAVVGGLSMSWILIAIWSWRCSMGFTSGLLGGHSMTSTSWFSRKSLVARVVRGGAFSWTRAGPITLEGGSYPGKESLLQHTSVHFLVHGAVQHNQLTFATIVKSSPFDEIWTDIITRCLYTNINMPVILPPMHYSSSMWVIQLSRRSTLPHPLQNFVTGTLCDTRNLSNINLSAPFKSLTMGCSISNDFWCGLVWTL